MHTYGGDTVLKIPKRLNDERAFLSEIQVKIRDIYFDGDRYEGQDRVDYLKRTLAELSQ